MITLKFSIAFIIAVILLVLRQEIWVVIAALSAVIPIIFKFTPRLLFQSFYKGTFGYSTLHLIVAVWFIISFGEALYRSGYLAQFVDSVEGLFRDLRIAFVVPSMIIGLLPMPSGAMLSAPLAEEIGKKMNLSAEDLTFFNYWFRHIWEYTWPLYPGIILTSSITNIPIWKISLHQLPMVLISSTLGFFILFKRLPFFSLSNEVVNRNEKFAKFVVVLWPIYLIILLVLIIRIDLVLGLALVLITLFISKKFSISDIWGSLRKGFSWKIFLILVFVMIFKKELELSGVLNHLPDEMIAWGLSPLIPLILIPFLIGFLTGVNPAYIGVAFPVLLGFFGKDLNLIFISYVSGFMGILLSPAHLCLAVTKTYFRADTAKLYRILLPSVIVLYGLFWLYMGFAKLVL